MIKKIRIASRKSKLALWQANHVAELLKIEFPKIETEIIGITTNGDKIQDVSLNAIGGKGLFIKELEEALLNNEADIAVHSLKDIPANLDDRFKLSAILQREDARDAFLSNKYKSIKEMPNHSIVGTSSVRRTAFLKKHHPHLNIQLLRGNVDTRLRKLDAGEYDAIILAAAGLKRLDLEARITSYLDHTIFIPAIAQGAIGIETMAQNEELYNLTKIFNHTDTSISVNLERMIGAKLGASCNLPIAIHANVTGKLIKVVAIVLSEDGQSSYYAKHSSTTKNYAVMADRCVDDLKNQGVANLLDKYK